MEERLKTPDRNQAASYPLRFSEELRQWLKTKAADNFRSLNSEIVARLEQSRKAEEAQHEKQT